MLLQIVRFVSFLKLSNIPSYVYTTFYLSIHRSIDRLFSMSFFSSVQALSVFRVFNVFTLCSNFYLDLAT